jgi:hypothetical protein
MKEAGISWQVACPNFTPGCVICPSWQRRNGVIRAQGLRLIRDSWLTPSKYAKQWVAMPGRTIANASHSAAMTPSDGQSRYTPGQKEQRIDRRADRA